MGLLDKFEKENNDYIEKEFEKSFRVVKKIFKENNWLRPRDWKQVCDWYYHKNKGKEGFKYPPDVKNEKILLEWARDNQNEDKKRENPLESIFSEDQKASRLKFQDIDFHIVLFKANLEPPGAQIDYLDRLRKQSKYKKDAFLIKLESAYDNIQKAWQNEFSHKRSYILNLDESSDFLIPISFFGRYQILSNFSRAFNGHIGRDVLEVLSSLIYRLSIYYKIKDFKKTISNIKIIDSDEKDSNKNSSEKEKYPFESIWQRNPQVSIDAFLEKGFDLGLWDENFNLIAKRGGIFGSKKALLANIYISLKGHSINEEIDHKKVGEVFCNFFNLKTDPKTENPFKQFQSGGNKKQVNELRKRLK